MKRIGLIGGMGPESTLDYYRELIEAFKDGSNALNYPDIIIYSVNLSEFLDLMKIQAYDKVVQLLAGKIESLRQAGADFAAITANTPHLLFDKIQDKVRLPLISIVEATCAEAKRMGVKNPGLFGTRFTMEGTFFQEVFERNGLPVTVPEAADIKLLHAKLFNEIELGIFKDSTREILIGIIQKMVSNHHIDSLILGCTEFPLILTESEYAGIPMLNTTRIHVKAIAEECRK